MIYFAIIVNILLLFKFWNDHRLKKKKKIVWHWLSALIDLIIYAISAFLLFGNEGYWVVVGWIILAGGYRWFAYDLGYNIINKEKLNHLGGSSGLDGFLKWFEKHGVSQYIIKALVILIGILIIRWA